MIYCLHSSLLKKEKSVLPKILIIPIGNKCNLNCGFCKIHSKKQSLKISIENIFKVIDWYKELNPNGYVTFYGGEPLANKKYLDIVRYVLGKKLKFCLITNGALINEKNVCDLKGVTKVVVSLDSHIKETHDTLRGISGTFEKTTNAMRMLCSRDMNVFSSMVLTSKNLNHFIEYCDFCENLGAKPIFNIIEPNYTLGNMNGFYMSEYRITNNQRNALESVLIEYQKRYPEFLSVLRLNSILDYVDTYNNRLSKYPNICDYKAIILENSEEIYVKNCFRDKGRTKISNFQDLKDSWENEANRKEVLSCTKYCSINCMNRFETVD